MNPLTNPTTRAFICKPSIKTKGVRSSLKADFYRRNFPCQQYQNRSNHHFCGSSHFARTRLLQLHSKAQSSSIFQYQFRFVSTNSDNSNPQIANVKFNNGKVLLSPSDFSNDPLKIFENWLNLTEKEGSKTAKWCTLSTIQLVDNKNDINIARPASRMVTCVLDSNGNIGFCTNKTSTKAHELKQNPHCALVFNWNETRTCVRVEGIVTSATNDYSDTAWAARNRQYMIYALATSQYKELSSVKEFEQKFEQMEEKYKNVDVIPRPNHWSAYWVLPLRYEFWKGSNSGCHQRYRYQRENVQSNQWTLKIIEP